MTPTTRDSVERGLVDSGYRWGGPDHIPCMAVLEDVLAYREMECEMCLASCQTVIPYHRGREYLLLVQCRTCGHTVEC